MKRQIELWKVLVISVIFGIVFESAFQFFQRKNDVAEGQKIEIQTQIKQKDSERTALEKSIQEAFEKGLHGSNQIEKKANEDAKTIPVIVISLPDSIIERIFSERFGKLEKRD